MRRAGRVDRAGRGRRQHLLPDHRPGPAGPLPPHAAGGQADLADVGGHLDPQRVRRGGGPGRGRRGGALLPRRGALGLAARALPAGRPGRRARRRRRSRRRWRRTPPCCSPTRRRRRWHEAYPRAAVRLRRQRAGQRRRRRPDRRTDPQAGPARRLAVAGAAMELCGAHGSETTMGLLSEPYRTGRAGRLLRAGRALTAAGVVGALLGSRSRVVSALAGGALLAARWRPASASSKGARPRRGPEVHGAPATRAPQRGENRIDDLRGWEVLPEGIRTPPAEEVEMAESSNPNPHSR